MSWIDFRKQKPETSIVALVCNERGFMHNTKAIYYADYDCWVNDSSDYPKFTLDVTHYLIVPPLPDLKD